MISDEYQVYPAYIYFTEALLALLGSQEEDASDKLSPSDKKQLIAHLLRVASDDQLISIFKKAEEEGFTKIANDFNLWISFDFGEKEFKAFIRDKKRGN